MGNDADSNSGTEDDIHSSTDFEFYLQGLERAKIIVNKPLPQVTIEGWDPGVKKGGQQMLFSAFRSQED
ncbi:hypothetical protein JHK82_055528 [Glycine max]|nr:hypothetical protein JHK86_055346 [Glycine max]KAG4918080.1 hypothetical protein JHK85_056361 [Glycine max]KAG5074155.1 hypothetical protein JHK84_055386 [Glycine max]KAG5076833.1 hypothetical protein JHK82_055528 [Glycine max]